MEHTALHKPSFLEFLHLSDTIVKSYRANRNVTLNVEFCLSQPVMSHCKIYAKFVPGSRWQYEFIMFPKSIVRDF